ncbi:MAG TPA: DNA-formamidopyrimidine glycosylase family protein [Bryobacteraceae bacterium]|nr:DNA-formamidopyrimidine glycosylase family protein [Bryobacteraceae bacterium]
MPELPDIVVYIEALEKRVTGSVLEKVRLGSPFLLRSVDPSPHEVEGSKVQCFRRLGKRIAMGLEGDRWVVLHLMIAGRLHWRKKGAPIGSRNTLAAFDFANGSLVLTEAGSQRRASLYLARSEEGLETLRRGGLEVLEATLADFSSALTRENHTLKRSLTDPDLFSGIGNAYSDEILHRAGLSPVALTSKLGAEEIQRLFEATKATLLDWVAKLRAETADGFPEGVTAFREEMAVHGRFGLPCPVCGAKVQRTATRPTRPTTAPGARRADGCWPIAGCRAC